MFPVALSEIIATLFSGAFALLAGVLTSRLAQDSKRESTKLEKALSAIWQKSSAPREAVTSTALKEEVGDSAALLLSADQEAKRPLVEGVTRLVEDYHEQGLSQAAVQFWFSVVAASIGFIWILYAGSQFKSDVPSTALKGIPGIVIDAVAALFFKQASETRQRATELYDRLRKDKQIDDAMGLVDAIDDPRARSAVRAQIALHLAGLTPGVLNLEYFLPPQQGAGENPAEDQAMPKSQRDDGRSLDAN